MATVRRVTLAILVLLAAAHSGATGSLGRALDGARSEYRELHERAGKDFNFLAAGSVALFALIVGTTGWVIVGVVRGLKARHDLPAPSQAYPFVPFERYTFETTIMPLDVAGTLFALDDLRRPTYPSRAVAGQGPGAFQARLSENNFTVRRSSPKNRSDSALNNPYLPIASAVIAPGVRGSVVNVTLRLGWFYAVPILFLLALVFADVLQGHAWLLIPTAIAHGLLYLLGWRPERARLLLFLQDALSGPARDVDRAV
jgi:hypothetical protein